MTVYRKLLPAEQGLYRDHLLRLDAQDRYARFCGVRSDAAIEDYCRRIDWRFAIIIGCFVDGVLRAAAEVRTEPGVWPDEGELAVSVERAFQNRGLGSRAVSRIITVARNRSIRYLTMICLPGNRRMQAIARNFGAVLAMEDGEAVARFALPGVDRVSLLAEAIDDSAALMQVLIGRWPIEMAPPLLLAA